MYFKFQEIKTKTDHEAKALATSFSPRSDVVSYPTRAWFPPVGLHLGTCKNKPTIIVAHNWLPPHRTFCSIPMCPPPVLEVVGWELPLGQLGQPVQCCNYSIQRIRIQRLSYQQASISISSSPTSPCPTANTSLRFVVGCGVLWSSCYGKLLQPSGPCSASCWTKANAKLSSSKSKSSETQGAKCNCQVPSAFWTNI